MAQTILTSQFTFFDGAGIDNAGAPALLSQTAIEEHANTHLCMHAITILAFLTAPGESGVKTAGIKPAVLNLSNGNSASLQAGGRR